MKVLLSGNEAVARGAWEAGVKFASSYPGTPSTEILENLVRYPEIYAEWAPNEKVALEAVIGASLSGKRAIASMKHVGLNVAADPFMTFSYTGVNGGVVIAVADDPGLYSSQNEQDTRNYVRAALIPALEPSDSQEALDFTRMAYEISETYDTPVLIRLVTRISHTKTVVETGERTEKEKEPEINPEKWVMLPAYARKRHPLVIERFKRLTLFSESLEINRMEIKDTSIGFITSGVVYQYVKEAFPEASVLKLGMIYPLPQKLIREFVEKVKTVYVVEELDPFLETEIKAAGIPVIGKEVFPRTGEFNPDVIRKSIDRNYRPQTVSFPGIPERPPTLCPGCPHRGVFVALRKAKIRALGDIGCYTLGAIPPLSALHSCICMGAGVSMEHGATTCGMERVVAVIGDSTFFHTGISSLMNIAYNRSPSTVLILDNRTTAMTGKQPHPGTGETAKGEKTKPVMPEEVAKAFGIERIRVVDPYNVEEFIRVLEEEVSEKEPSVIISRRPCTLITKRPDTVYRVDKELCIGCKRCLSVGCIALKMEDGKAEIDPLLCFGCGICAVECPKDAIVEGKR